MKIVKYYNRGEIFMRRILLIDADQQSIEKLKREIDWSYYGFIIQDSVFKMADTLSIIKKNTYDLYLLNLRHLNTFGFELCRQIRGKTSNPILLIEGDKDFEMVQRAISLQVSSYLPEPLNTEELIESLLNIKDVIEEKKTKTITYTTKKPGSTQQNNASNIIEVVKDYVEQCIHENITLKDISNDLHYNSSYLGQKFKSQEKMTFNQYLLNRRMEKTKFLLRYTDLKIYEIAYQVGYTDLDWFYKKFKEHTGLSASAYRYQFNESVNIKAVQAH
ncbi:helix-turn-helix domain-containing protein [Gracilibacillus salitolerans]|uniref:Helix-turn-helix domain-containing protein n=2 Tax=Gracilibacillus salitolerans TaxID=2663022 RepID=A0A5Q2TH18_9BACI|nr:helix-turn-helix domain-containing protein [Gracilibacillus salitolerans]